MDTYIDLKRVFQSLCRTNIVEHWNVTYYKAGAVHNQQEKRNIRYLFYNIT